MRETRFLRAARGEPVDVTPVWLMRQAGRYLPEYRAIRSKAGFLELCRTPERAAEVTLQPVDRLGVDAAILFSDILVIFDGLGIPIEFAKGEGPVIDPPLRTEQDILGLRVFDPAAHVPYVLETIRLLRRELAGKVPLIGFSGAPFTLATYAVEGGTSRNFQVLKALMYRAPALFDALMTRLGDAVALYLAAQIDAGVQAVQLFDTWAAVLAPGDYARFVMPHTRRIIERIRPKGVPIIHYTNGCGHLLPHLHALGADVLSIDWRTDLGTVIDTLGDDIVVQGNLDPAVLYAPAREIEARAAAVCEEGRRARGHIFNLGHGIFPDVDPASAKVLVDAVHAVGGVGVRLA